MPADHGFYTPKTLTLVFLHNQTNTTKNLNNKEFINALAKRTGYKTEDVQRIVRATLNTITTQLTEGNSVTFTRLGTFDVKKRMERIMNNPSTGKKMLVPPKLVVNFKPQKGLDLNSNDL